MSVAFVRFGWGVVFTLLDFRFVFFDVLPDVVEYAFMWRALRKLGQLRNEYLKVESIAALLTLSSLTEIIPIWGDPGWSAPASIPLLVYTGTVLFLTLIMVNHFLYALSRHAAEVSAKHFAATVIGRRKFFVLISAVWLLVLPFSLNWTQSAVMEWTIVISILYFVAQLLLFFTCRHAAKFFST